MRVEISKFTANQFEVFKLGTVVCKILKCDRVSELVYLMSLLDSQGLMSDGPGAGQ